MSSPKVSICIPAYRQPVLIKRTLDSIFLQDYTDYEIIITDDSPDDLTERAVKSYASDKIIYRRNSAAKGSPENWNEAIGLATGEYVKIMHHDDWFVDATCLREFVRMLDDNPVSNFAFSACYGHNTRTGRFLHEASEDWIAKLKRDRKIIFSANNIGAPSVTIYRRKINEKFDKKLKWQVDVDFYVRALGDGNNFVFSKRPLVNITSGEDFQVTAGCVTTSSVELFEWYYVYKKIGRPISLVNLKNIAHLLFKYRIKNLNEFKSIVRDDLVMEVIIVTRIVSLLVSVVSFFSKKTSTKNV